MYSLYVHITRNIWKILRTCLKKEMVIKEMARKLVRMNQKTHGYARFWVCFLLLPQLALYSPAWIMKIDCRKGESEINHSVLLKQQSKKNRTYQTEIGKNDRKRQESEAQQNRNRHLAVRGGFDATTWK